VATRAIDPRNTDSRTGDPKTGESKTSRATTEVRGADTRSDCRARRYDPAETRQRVLTAAHFLFSTKGFANTGTADIAREADVSEGSIFYHFGSKKALLTELGARHGEQLIAAMEEGYALEDLEPGIIVPRVFAFVLANSLLEDVALDACDAGNHVQMKNPEAEPFYHASKAATVGWLERQMTVAMAKRGTTGVNVPLAASFTHHIVGDAIEMYLAATTQEERDAIEAETVRFVRAASGFRA
jgi:AcrR family transcriptional regulator